MIREKIIVAILLATTFVLPVTGWAGAEETPTWVYTNLLALAQAGIITLPPGVNSSNIRSLSKKEITILTGEALQKKTSQGPVAPQPVSNNQQALQQWLQLSNKALAPALLMAKVGGLKYLQTTGLPS